MLITMSANSQTPESDGREAICYLFQMSSWDINPGPIEMYFAIPYPNGIIVYQVKGILFAEFSECWTREFAVFLSGFWGFWDQILMWQIWEIYLFSGQVDWGFNCLFKALEPGFRVTIDSVSIPFKNLCKIISDTVYPCSLKYKLTMISKYISCRQTRTNVKQTTPVGLLLSGVALV